MPYVSPNIVIIPTMEKKTRTQIAPTGNKASSTPIIVNVLEQTPPVTTKTSRESPSSTNVPPSENTNKELMENVKMDSQGTVTKPVVSQSDTVNKNSVRPETLKKSTKPASWASNYLQSISQSTNAMSMKVNLLSTSNDVIKQAVSSAGEVKGEKEIKINLLSRPNVVKSTDAKARPPLLQIPNFSSGVRPCTEPTWSRPPLIQTPNQNIYSRPCMSTTSTRPFLLQTPTNMSNKSWSRPSCLTTTSNLNIDPRPCMNTAWTHPTQLQTPTNVGNNPMPLMDATWGYPSVFQTSTHSYNSSPYMDTTWSYSYHHQSPNPPTFITDVRSPMNTNTWPTQEPFPTTIFRQNENINANNITSSLVREPQTTHTKITSHETSTSFKSRMDYTWLTRAHYANSNNSNKTQSKVKQVSNTKNTDKYVRRPPTNIEAKETIKPTLECGWDSKIQYCDGCSNEEYVHGETTNIKLASDQKNTGINKNTNKELREKDKSEIKKAIKTLEKKLKQLNSVKQPFKIPKLSNSNKNEYVEPCQEQSAKSSELQHIKNKVETKTISTNKKETKNKQITKKSLQACPEPEQPCKKRDHRDLGNNEDNIPKKIRKLSHGKDHIQQRLIRRKSTEINSHSKNKNNIHTNNNDRNDKYKNRSDKVETECSDKAKKKRKLSDSSYSPEQNKRFRHESENTDKNVKNNYVKSVVASKKTTEKHPRIQAPESDESDDDLESNFDLRSKLSSNYKLFNSDVISLKANVNNQTETPRENLLITVNQNYNDETVASSKPEPSILKQKSKKYKKIRLVINVIQEDSSDDSSSDASKETIIVNSTGGSTNEHLAKRKLDLSFLDDFNIDEIVNSLKHNPKQENVQQNIKQKIENTKTSPESVTNKFVQPIIIKSEIKTEHADSEILSEGIHVQKNTLDNVTTSVVRDGSLNPETIAIKPDDILNAGNGITKENLIQNVKQEKHENQIEQINIDNANTAMAFLNEDVLRSVNQLIDMVVENMEAVIDTSSAAKNIWNIKREPDEIDDDDNINQDNEEQDLHTLELNGANKVFTHIIKQEKHEDQMEKINENNSNIAIAHPETSLDADVLLQTANQLIGTVVENSQAVIDCSRVGNPDWDLTGDIYDDEDIDRDNEHQLSYDASKNYNLEIIDKELSAGLIEKEPEGLDCPNSYEFSKDKRFDKPNQDKVGDIEEENNNKIIKSSEIATLNLPGPKDTILLEIEEKAPEGPMTNSLEKCDVITKDNNDPAHIKSRVLKTVTMNDLHKTEAIQLKVIDKSATDSLVTSSVAIVASHNVKVSSEVLLKTISLEQDVNVTETITPEVKHNIGISDITIKNNNEVTISSQVIKTISLDHDVNASQTTQAHVKEKSLELATNTSATSNATIKDKVKIRSDVVKPSNIEIATGTIIQKVEEKSLGNKPALNIKSDIATEDKINEIDKHNEVPNSSTDSRTVTMTHPSLKSNKVLAIKIEERIFNYLNLKLNVVSLINHGKFAKVFRCKGTDGQDYALKILKNEQDRHSRGFKKEKMWKELQNDIPKANLNLIYLINGFGLDRKWCFLMEYYPINLKQALGKTKFNMDSVQELAKQLAAAVLMIRSNNIVHSDIKPAHILLDSTYKRLKVCGFDAAYNADTVEVLPNIGTMQYRAPEIILGYSAGFSVDVWATALVMYEVAAGTKLFDSKINYNNNVLFNQMCLCGDLPIEMALNSNFSSYHFAGTVFKRIVGPRGQYVLYNMNKFNVKTKTYNILKSIYKNNWYKCQSKVKLASDMSKLSKMCFLLDKMLVLNPHRRIPIEFVYADAFFK